MSAIPTIKGKVTPIFPALVTAMLPILLSTTSGTYAFSLDMDAITANVVAQLDGEALGNLVTVKQRGVGAISRTLLDKNYEHVSVGDFKSVLDTDDTNSFDRALTAALTYGHSVYAPAKTYTLSATIAKVIAPAARKGIYLYGDGSELTVLKFTNAGDGFTILLNNSTGSNGNRLLMEKLSIATTNPGALSAISVNGGGGNFNEIGPYFHDVTIKSYDDIGSWAVGWNFGKVTKTVIQNCTWLGKFPTGGFTEANMLGTSIAYDGNGDHDVDNCHFTYFDKAIQMAVNMEGVFVTNCQMVAGNWGVYNPSTAYSNGITYLTMENCHVNTYTGVFRSGWCNWVKITGVFSILFDAGTPVGPYVGYDVAGDSTLPGRSIIISNCIMNLDNRSYAVTGISGNYLSGAIFSGNTIENNNANYGTAFSLSNSTGVKFNLNTVRGMNAIAYVPPNNTNISFNDNTLYTSNSGFSFAGSTGSRSSNVSICNNTFSGMVSYCLSLDSLDRAVIAANVDTSAAPAAGSWITNGTHASKGSYSFSGNVWSSAAQGAFDTASTYNYINEVGLQPNVDMAIAAKSGKNVAFGSPITLSTALAVTSGGTGQTTIGAFKTALTLVKGDVGLGNVDNTSDATKNAASATLTNKTIDTAAASNTFKINGTTVATAADFQAALASGTLTFKLSGANFNSTADQAITLVLPTGFTRYRFQAVNISNPSTSLTTAVGGVYTAAAKGGIAVIAASQVYSALTTNTAGASGSMLIPTVTNAATAFYNSTTLYLSLTTAQGSAATADVTVIIQPLP